MPIEKSLFRATLLCFFLVLLGNSVAQRPLAANYEGEYSHRIFSDSELKDQLRAIPDLLVRPECDKVFLSYIRSYAVKNRPRTEKMLGRRDLYFPMFEKYLLEEGLPLSLKYVAMLESALDPMATSRSGAAGLWQIMPITAKDMKLKVSRYIDDRRDPVKSTKAAIKYLKKLYNRFGSWELALAAYNGGQGRVARAIKRTGINDFWNLREHLPRETRNYVTAFLGASYIGNYYSHYELRPEFIDYRIVDAVDLEVDGLLKFEKVAELTGMNKELIQELNARYPRAYIPEYRKSLPLKLPRLESILMANYLGIAEAPPLPPNHRVLNYEVVATDDFLELCRTFKCSPEQAATWNNLQSINLTQGQKLKFYQPIVKKVKRKLMAEMEQIPSKQNFYRFIAPERKLENQPTLNVESFEVEIPKTTSRIIQMGKQKYYVVGFGETLSAIASSKLTPNLSTLLKLNNLKVHSNLKQGQRILIQEK